jgi:hypothetical protein
MLRILILAAAIGANDGSWGNHQGNRYHAERTPEPNSAGDAITEPAPPPNPGDAYTKIPSPRMNAIPARFQTMLNRRAVVVDSAELSCGERVAGLSDQVNRAQVLSLESRLDWRRAPAISSSPSALTANSRDSTRPRAVA